MKKALSALLVAALSIGLVACNKQAQPKKDNDTSSKQETKDSKDSTESKGGETEIREVDLTLSYASEPESMDYLVTDKTSDSDLFTNFVDGLYENDRFGNIVPALAESYEVNDDATEFTYHLKKGIKWFTATGEEYAEVTAHDWVTAMQHAADFKSSGLWLVKDIIKNLDKYVNGEVGFDQVGVKAKDDYTLVYSLNSSTPYFHSMTLYSILYPVNKEFLESKGTGCKLGSPDKANCQFGTLKPDSILYNGAYILTTADSKSKLAYKKNTNYWDASNVHFKSITKLFDNGKDPYSTIKGFENGVYNAAALSPVWKDFDNYKAKYKDYIVVSLPNASAFGINFNYNRVATSATNKDAAGLDRTRKAILNTNFRKAILHAFDRVAYMKQSMPEEIAVSTLRNINNFPEIVSDSHGTIYGDLVTKAYKEMTGEDINLADGQDPFLNPELALEFIKKAEAEGIEFPVTLDLPYISNDSEVYANRAKSVKASLEKNTQGKILVDVIPRTKDEIVKTMYRMPNFKESDYDINLFSGWGPDYSDPKTFCDTYSKNGGPYMKNIGFAEEYGTDKESDAAYDQTPWGQYQELIEAADKITNDLDKRYEAYAKADAFIVANALMVPHQQQIRGYRISKFAPFTGPYGNTGVAYMKTKGIYLQDEIVTKQQYNEAYVKWTQERVK